MKFAFGLEPKLDVPPERFAIFFPNFTGALADTPLVGPCQCDGPSSAFFGHCPYASGSFPVANPSCEVAVFLGLGQQAADELRSIHLHSPLDRRWNRKIVQVGRKELTHLT